MLDGIYHVHFTFETTCFLEGTFETTPSSCII